MTKIVNILATENVEKEFVRQPIEFYLAHKILEHPEIYQKARIPSDSYKIVDCSACELGTGVSMQKVLEAARMVKASEVILPDKVGHSMISLRMSLQALRSLNLKELNEFKIAIVIQGRNTFEATYALNYLKNSGDLCLIDTIMIPKWFKTYQREVLTKFIKTNFPKKQVHWLGLGDDIANCISTAKTLNIRSLDTGYFISIAQGRATKILNPVRDKHHKIDLEHNKLKDWQIQEVIEATNEYDYGNRLDNSVTENMKDREFSQLMILYVLIAFIAIIIGIFLSIFL